VNFFVGKQKFKLYNLYSIFQLAIHILLIFGFVYFFDLKDITTYFVAQIICNSLLFLVSCLSVAKTISFGNIKFSQKEFNSIFSYGFKTQFSAFTQFLNYRLSYYFLEFYKGVSSVGIYSVGIAFSEAIWVFSKSFSVVLYSEVVNSKDISDSIARTKTSLKLCFSLTFFLLLILLLVPSQFYSFVFGKDFNETKNIIVLLSPGVLAIAASNIIGHYFSGINQLKILNIKSLVGLFFTITLSFYFIPRWGIYGACMVTSISYILSSAVLFWKFYTITSFRLSDFIISIDEIKTAIKKDK
jgi:O-antigen/teichoic acid export membrane protein